MRTPNLRSERGIALVAAIVALVVIGALVAGTFFVSSLEQKTAENSVDAAEAYQAAEAGIVKNVANWDTGNNALATDHIALPLLRRGDPVSPQFAHRQMAAG